MPPGPRLPAVVQTYLAWRWPFAYPEACRSRYGSRYTKRMAGFPPLVILSDHAEIGEMFAAPADVLLAGRGAADLAPIVGDGSFMLQDGERHSAVRRAVLPQLRGRAVQRHADLVAEIARRAVSEWPRNAVLPLHAKLRALTLEVVMGTMFASLRDTFAQELRALRDALLRMLAVTASAVLPEPALRHGPGRMIWERFLRDRDAADELLYSLIEAQCRADRTGGEGIFGALLEVHGERGGRCSTQGLRDDVMSLVLAGHETTAAALSWAFQLLAHNPEASARLSAEIRRGEGEGYLTATVQEVLRDRPVFPFTIPREVGEGIGRREWPYDSSTQVMGCIYLVHHDPALFDAPHAFRPERFLQGPPRPQIWLPWGGGRRRCPGLHLATLEMKTILRTALSEVLPRPAAKRIERPRWRSVIVVPHAGSRVVLEPCAPRSFAPPGSGACDSLRAAPSCAARDDDARVASDASR